MTINSARAFLLLFIATLPATAHAQKVTLQSKITTPQPMTGVVLWSDSDHANTDAITLEYRYCGYNEVVDADGKYNFTKIDKVLDEIASRNHQAILRFYFVYVGKRTTVPEFIRRRPGYDETIATSEGKKTHFCDWSHPALQEFAIDFYSRFAERYNQDQRIAFLQTGFGLWAEYHIYDGPRKLGKTFPSKQFQKRFFTHLDKQFTKLPWSVSIDSADYDYSPLEDNAELLALNFGAFDDSFLCKPHPKENAVNWKTLDPKRWERAPAGGEFSYYNRRDQKQALAKQGPNGTSFADAARQFHISYMIGNDQPEHRTLAEIKSASLSTGYRFRVVDAEFNDNTLSLQVTNNGVAPIYRDAYFAIKSQRSTTSLKGLLPGETLKCTVSGVKANEVRHLEIQCDCILPTQSIQFEADLK